MKRFNSALIGLFVGMVSVSGAVAACNPALDPDLTHAVLSSDAARVDVLLGQGACPDAKDSTGYTALMSAVKMASFPIAKSLIGKGADTHAKIENGPSVLSLANDIPDAAIRGQIAELLYTIVEEGKLSFVTYKGQMSKIFKDRCAKCHFEDSNLSDFSTYAVAFKRKSQILKRVVTKRDMPTNNSTHMTDAEIDATNKWVLSGAAEQ
jgi:ankyrin repeat protein